MVGATPCKLWHMFTVLSSHLMRACTLVASRISGRGNVLESHGWIGKEVIMLVFLVGVVSCMCLYIYISLSLSLSLSLSPLWLL